MELDWKTNVDLSALHAAWCLNVWSSASRQCSQELRRAAVELAAAMENTGAPADRFWELLLTLSVDTPGNRDLAERVLARLLPVAARTEARLSELAGSLATFEARYLRDFPNYESSMRLRSEPLKQQWQAYGPGLLVLIGNSTDSDLIADRADVMLVEPFLGGAGFAHLATNRCHIEAVLTNVDPQLTETLRLAWLLSQLQLDRPATSEWINSLRLRQVAGLAMVPPTLQAGEELGLCVYSADAVRRAIDLWRIAGPSDSSAAWTQVVMTWWETVRASEPKWHVALAGLDRMLTQLIPGANALL